MIKIRLKTGEVLINDPEYGLNLFSKDEIRDCLEVCGRYYVMDCQGRERELAFKDVDDIREED